MICALRLEAENRMGRLFLRLPRVDGDGYPIKIGTICGLHGVDSIIAAIRSVTATGSATVGAGHALAASQRFSWDVEERKLLDVVAGPWLSSVTPSLTS